MYFTIYYIQVTMRSLSVSCKNLENMYGEFGNVTLHLFIYFYKNKISVIVIIVKVVC